MTGPQNPGLHERRLPLPFHPLLVGALPVLQFTHENYRNTEAWRAIAPVLLCAVFGAVLAVLLTFVFRNVRKGALVASMWSLGLTSHQALGSSAIGLWIAIVAGSVVVARWPKDLQVGTTFANALAVIAFVLLGFPLVQDQRRPLQPAPKRHWYQPLEEPKVMADAELPDIWYLTVDGYGRADVLKKYFDYQDPLPDLLRSKGFYVPPNATANYGQTALAFSSALNMDYVSALLEPIRGAGDERLVFRKLCAKNRVTETLRRAGYRIVAYPGEYSMTRHETPDEDRHVQPLLSEFEYALMDSTPLGDVRAFFGFPPAALSHAIRRRAIRWTLKDLEQGDRWPGPTFVFAHIVAPHAPFVFKPDGSNRRTFGPGALFEARLRTELPKGESYVDGYREQVAFLGQALSKVVDGILQSSQRAPIILVQSDHGPASRMDWANAARSVHDERMSILSAYFVPENIREKLYADITPVNSFRVLFNGLLGTQLPLLEDRNLYASWEKPYVHVDVTARVRDLGAKPEAAPERAQSPR